MHKKLLMALAVLCQFLVLFPFLVMSEGIGFGGFTWWHYAAMYAAAAAFWAVGRLLCGWASGAGLSRRGRAWAVFLSRVGFIAPGAAFCVVCGMAGLHSGLYLYLLPGCIAAYFGGYLSVGKDYSEVFSRGWFGVYFVAAVIAAVLLSFTHDDLICSTGMSQLCVSFGALIIVAAVLTNQTNIDVQTRQRAGGRAVLPAGVRRTNALMIAAVGAVIVGLFMFAKPFGNALFEGIRALVRFLMSLLNRGRQDVEDDNELAENTGDPIDYTTNENPYADLLMYLLAAGIVFLIVKFRRQIWGFIREIFAPLFKEPVREEAAPFFDEVSASGDAKYSSVSGARTERELLKRYRRETDPAMKYREGYELFLMRLGRTAFPQLPTDTTTLHTDKGAKAFAGRVPEGDIPEMIRTYDRVRYGGEIPDSNELERLDRLLQNIKAH